MKNLTVKKEFDDDLHPLLHKKRYKAVNMNHKLRFQILLKEIMLITLTFAIIYFIQYFV